MNCTICRKPIKLVPSATYRASIDRDPTHTAAWYTRQFTTHTACALEARKEQVEALIKRHYS